MNLKQLSQLLGLSQTTVSRALNGYPEVNAETRQRVLDAVRETGYRPNRAAQRLATGRAGSIGLVMPTADGIESDVHFGEFLAGLGDEAVKHDFHFVINPSHPEDEVATCRRLVASGNVDALFFAYMREKDPRIAMMKSLKTPFIVHGLSIGIPADYPFLDIDNTGLFYDAARLLAQLGHRHFALINGPDYLTFAMRRRKGTERALGEYGLVLREDCVQHSQMTDEYGFRAIIAPSYADIFFNNSFKNGLLPIILKDEEVDELFQQCEATEGYQLTVDLAAQTVTRPDGKQYSFEVDAFRKHCLLNGLDDIGLTLQDADAIRDFEAGYRQRQPWLFRDA